MLLHAFVQGSCIEDTGVLLFPRGHHEYIVGSLAYATEPRYVVSTSTQNMWLCLLPPATSRQRAQRKKKNVTTAIC